MALHKSGEDYLEAILILSKKNGVVKAIDVANFLKYSRPSVTIAMDILEKDGFLIRDEKKNLSLTEKGMVIASEMYKRHCFLVNLLETIGVDEETAESEGCAVEHILSDKTFKLLQKAAKPLISKNRK